MRESRPIEASVFAEARSRGLDPVIARIVAGRISDETPLDVVLDPQLQHIAPPSELTDITKAADRLQTAIRDGERIGVLTDYDADGLTSHAVITESLQRFGVSPENISHWIGHRLEDGYGISETLVDRLLESLPVPQVLISAECGSSDEVQIVRLKDAGVDVIVTDHHRVSDRGPPASAWAVVNPNRADCRYPDKAIAGCMVSWLVMSFLRQRLIDQGVLVPTTPKLGDLLDYVALGTVADCVSLGSSETNRAVVKAGLSLIAGQQTIAHKKDRPFLQLEESASHQCARVETPDEALDWSGRRSEHEQHPPNQQPPHSPLASSQHLDHTVRLNPLHRHEFVRHSSRHSHSLVIEIREPMWGGRAFPRLCRSDAQYPGV